MMTKNRWKMFQAWMNDSDSKWAVFKGDAIECMKRLPDGSIDLIVTDFPYESLEKHRARGTTTRLKKSKASSNRWFDIFPNERIPELIAECYRVLADDGHCYLFSDDETSDVLRMVVKAMEQEHPKACFKWWKRLVWDKKKIGMGYHWRARYEFIIFLEKGKRALNNKGWPDVLPYERVSKKILGRPPEPTEKPQALLNELIVNSSDQGELVLDPFCGSGAGGMAALDAGCEFLGFDSDSYAVKFSRRRLKGWRPA